jgi:hypothetical protein
MEAVDAATRIGGALTAAKLMAIYQHLAGWQTM